MVAHIKPVSAQRDAAPMAPGERVALTTGARVSRPHREIGPRERVCIDLSSWITTVDDGSAEVVFGRSLQEPYIATVWSGETRSFIRV